MNITKLSYLFWAILFAVCAALGFVPTPDGAVYYLLMALSLLFFAPPAVILYRAVKDRDVKNLRRVRNLCFLSLGMTLLLLILNFASVAFTALVGKILYWILIVVSAPMVCCQNWVVSLFLWGCLLTVSLEHLHKEKKKENPKKKRA